MIASNAKRQPSRNRGGAVIHGKVAKESTICCAHITALEARAARSMRALHRSLVSDA